MKESRYFKALDVGCGGALWLSDEGGNTATETASIPYFNWLTHTISDVMKEARKSLNDQYREAGKHDLVYEPQDSQKTSLLDIAQKFFNNTIKNINIDGIDPSRYYRRTNDIEFSIHT